MPAGRNHLGPVRIVGGVLAAFSLTGLAVGCGETGSQQGGPETTTTRAATTTTPPDTSVPPEAVATEFMGLTKADAIALAEAQARPWRIAREDDESFPLTADYSENRVNFEIDDGKVTLATFG